MSIELLIAIGVGLLLGQKPKKKKPRYVAAKRRLPTGAQSYHAAPLNLSPSGQAAPTDFHVPTHGLGRMPWTKLKAWLGKGRELYKGESDKLQVALHDIYRAGAGYDGYTYRDALLQCSALSQRIKPHKYYAFVPIRVHRGMYFKNSSVGTPDEFIDSRWGETITRDPAGGKITPILWQLQWLWPNWNWPGAPYEVRLLVSVLKGADVPPPSQRFVPMLCKFTKDKKWYDYVIPGVAWGLVAFVGGLALGPAYAAIASTKLGATLTSILAAGSVAIEKGYSLYASLNSSTSTAFNNATDAERLMAMSDAMVQSALDGKHVNLEQEAP